MIRGDFALYKYECVRVKDSNYITHVHCCLAIGVSFKEHKLIHSWPLNDVLDFPNLAISLAMLRDVSDDYHPWRIIRADGRCESDCIENWRHFSWK